MAPEFVSPKTVICPVPFALILKSILVSPPVAFIDGGLPVAAFVTSVSYTHLRAHETVLDLVCRLLLEKKKK